MERQVREKAIKQLRKLTLLFCGQKHFIYLDLRGVLPVASGGIWTQISELAVQAAAMAGYFSVLTPSAKVTGGRYLIKESAASSVPAAPDWSSAVIVAQDGLTLGQGEANGTGLSSPPPVTYPAVPTADRFGNGWWKWNVSQSEPKQGSGLLCWAVAAVSGALRSHQDKTLVKTCMQSGQRDTLISGTAAVCSEKKWGIACVKKYKRLLQVLTFLCKSDVSFYDMLKVRLELLNTTRKLKSQGYDSSVLCIIAMYVFVICTWDLLDNDTLHLKGLFEINWNWNCCKWWK